MKKILIPLLMTTVLGFSACTKTVAPTTVEEAAPDDTMVQQPSETPGTVTIPQAVPTDVAPTTTTPTSKSYTADEVATHKNGLSCWLIIEEKVYDVTDFIAKHRSDAILRGCGKDATQMFSKHSEGAKEMKELYFIGNVSQ